MMVCSQCGTSISDGAEACSQCGSKVFVERNRRRFTIPTNTWMNDPQYLAQVGHFLGGAIIILLVAVFFGVWRAPLIAWGIFLPLTAAKEFIYDARWEIPKQRNLDNWEDFGFYQFGAVAAMLVIWLAHHLGRL